MCARTFGRDRNSLSLICLQSLRLHTMRLFGHGLPLIVTSGGCHRERAAGKSLTIESHVNQISSGHFRHVNHLFIAVRQSFRAQINLCRTFNQYLGTSQSVAFVAQLKLIFRLKSRVTQNSVEQFCNSNRTESK